MMTEYGPGYGTHWEDCWRSHLGCAVARVERLEEAVDALIEERDAYDEDVEECRKELAEYKALADGHPSGDDCIHCGERPATNRGHPWCTVCYYEYREQAQADEYNMLRKHYDDCREALAAAEARGHKALRVLENIAWLGRNMPMASEYRDTVQMLRESDHAALDAYVEERTENIRMALRRAQQEASEAEAEAHELRCALIEADPENPALERTVLRSAALDAALEQRTIFALREAVAQLRKTDDTALELAAQGWSEAEVDALCAVLEAHRDGLEQARGFRDAWKTAAKRWRSRAIQAEYDAAVFEGEMRFQRRQRLQMKRKLEQARAEGAAEVWERCMEIADQLANRASALIDTDSQDQWVYGRGVGEAALKLKAAIREAREETDDA